ncbi:hypothetical protein HELRODRAFT_178865 [Helobdella robusta]|uniref:Uncharacterized protein n=1 Tax=Helobdella robusta TaxID=6412 RepID=T1FDU2_HELRO|nr:hypothetical protein HELRODRAFT_178865 [Helobdella robusta]ESN95947.1 hypothetical protein HELRODRAFT_178865 [Helobdella robusta]
MATQDSTNVPPLLADQEGDGSGHWHKYFQLVHLYVPLDVFMYKIVPLTTVEDCFSWLLQQKGKSTEVLSGVRRFDEGSLKIAHKDLELKIENESNVYSEFRQSIRKDEYESHLFEMNKKHMEAKYDQLIDENVRNLATLKSFIEISVLQKPISELSHTVDETTMNIVQMIKTSNPALGDDDDDDDRRRGYGNDPAREGNDDDREIFYRVRKDGLIRSWKVIEDLTKCLVVHVRHSSSYCQVL